MAGKKRRIKGEGSVYWSPSRRRWIASIVTESGKRQSFLGPVDDESPDAKRGVEDRLGAHRSTNTVHREAIGAWCARYIATAEIAPKTRSWYEGLLSRYIEGTRLASKPIAEITKRDLRTYLDGLEVGAPTVRGVYALLHRVFAVAVEKDALAVSPMVGLRKPAHKAAKRPVWTPEQVRAFLDAAKSSDYYAWFAIALTTTMGPAEIGGLYRDDVSLDGGYLVVQRNLSTEGVIGPTKNEHRIRRISLPKMTVDALRAHLGGHDSPFVFPSRQGGPLKYYNFRRRVYHPIVKKAKVPLIRLYDLRHTANALMGHLGVSLLVASRRMGHASIEQTANTYGHLYESGDQEVATVLDAFFA